MIKQYIKILALITAGLLPAVSIYGQVDTTMNAANNKKTNKILLGSTLVYSAGLIGLNQLWYADYEQSSFQLFNDNSEWLQIDKVGHMYSSFTLTKLSYALYPENGNRKKHLLYAGGSAFAFLTTIEIFDGFSKEWGFSSGDFIANTSGIGLFVVQEMLFEKQIVQLKYAYHNTRFSDLRPNTLGSSTLQSAFKDYNGQTYWASFNLNSISKKIQPKWLNLAFGYGGTGMVRATSDPHFFEGQNFYPRREYYLSLDIDWSKIETNKKWLEWCFKVANCIKIPAPSLRFKKDTDPVFYGIYF